MLVTNIFFLANSWLSKPERMVAFDRFFTEKEKTKLLTYRKISLKLLSQAKIIVVDNKKADGCLGDSIRDSRLVGVVNDICPNKIVLHWSTFPEIFGKHPFITQVKRQDEKIIFSYQKTQDTDTLRIEADPKQVVKIIPRYCGVCPAMPFTKDCGKGILLPQVPLHEVQRLQVVWEITYGARNLDCLPPPSIKISEGNLFKSRQTFIQLPVVKNESLNIIIHPDAHNNHFREKRWATKKWTELIKVLTQRDPKIKIFLTTGANHPQLSEEINTNCQKQNLPLCLLPQMNFVQYVGLLTLFPKTNTVFVGLESMAASHLAPGIGLRSVVIASDKVFDPLIYGPFGGIVVMSNDHQTKSVSVQKDFEAIHLLIS